MSGVPARPERITPRRTFCLPGRTLSLRRLAAFESILRGIAEGLVDAFAAKGRVELVEAFAIALPGNFIVDLLGLPREHLAQVNRWTTDSAEIFAGHKPLAQLIEYARGFVAYQHYLAAAVESRRANPRDDALSDIVSGAAPP